MRKPTRRFQARTSRNRRLTSRRSAADAAQSRMHSRTHTRAHPRTQSSVGHNTVRISRLRLRFHHWYRGLTWPTRIGILFGIVFTAMTVLPVGVAAAIHRGITYASTNGQEWNQTADARTSIAVYRESTQTAQTMGLNTYILDVMAAEVDPNAPMPALQAAAVAVRTFALHAQQAPEASAHGANVTDSASADLPLWDTTQQKQAYGVAYAADVSRLQTAITSTDAITMRISGKPILAFITAQSPGRTRDGSKELPSHPSYLPSTACPADVSAANGRQEFRIPKAQLAAKLNIPVNRFNLSSLKPTNIDAAGYANDVTDGIAKWTASSFAAALQLPSTHMEFEIAGSVLVIQTEGIGTGYGMSLNQAVADAKRGEDWQTILNHFYSGVTFTRGQ